MLSESLTDQARRGVAQRARPAHSTSRAVSPRVLRIGEVEGPVQSEAAYSRGVRFPIVLAMLAALWGCQPKPVTCKTYGVEHGSVPSMGPTSFQRDLATATFSQCSDGRTYSVQCRHGSIHTDCECAIDGAAVLRVKGRDRLPDDQTASTAWVNERCEWALR